MFGWINEKSEFYGKSIIERMDEAEKLSDMELFGVLLAEKGFCPEKEECEKITQSDDYMPYGLSELQVKRLKAIRELLTRYNGRKRVVLRRPEEIYSYTRHYAYEEQENLIVLTFNGNGEVLNVNNATKGLADRTVVHPREVFKECIRNSGVSVILVHNHPSGKLEPSQEDKTLTRSISEAGKLLGIKVLDHLIITQSGYYSFREEGLIL